MADKSTVVAPGTLWILRKHKPEELQVRCLLGRTQTRTVSGYARIGQVERPKQRSITEWTGSDPLRVEVSFIIDYFTEPEGTDPGVKCERDIRAIEEMAGFRGGENWPGYKPPKLEWYANAPHDNQENPKIEWWIENLTWGDAMYNQNGRRERQEGVLTLVQVIEGGYLKQDRKKGSRSDNKPRRRDRDSHRKGIQKRYKVRTRDKSLRAIAKEQLGNAELWPQIAKLNGLRGPNRTKKWPDFLKMP